LWKTKSASFFACLRRHRAVSYVQIPIRSTSSSVISSAVRYIELRRARAFTHGAAYLFSANNSLNFFCHSEQLANCQHQVSPERYLSGYCCFPSTWMVFTPKHTAAEPNNPVMRTRLARSLTCLSDDQHCQYECDLPELFLISFCLRFVSPLHNLDFVRR
jgi:hypothetical protein